MIPGRVTPPIVDHLESVEVAEEDGAGRSPRQYVVELLDKFASIGQVREGVATRLLAQLRFGPISLRRELTDAGRDKGGNQDACDREGQVVRRPAERGAKAMCDGHEGDGRT